MPQRAERNPQTVAFLEMLGVPYNLDHVGSATPAPGLLVAGKRGVNAASVGFGVTGMYACFDSPVMQHWGLRAKASLLPSSVCVLELVPALKPLAVGNLKV